MLAITSKDSWLFLEWPVSLLRKGKPVVRRGRKVYGPLLLRWPDRRKRIHEKEIRMAAPSTLPKQALKRLIPLFAAIGAGRARASAAVFGVLAAALLGMGLPMSSADAATTCADSLQAKIDGGG
jgi:hypothetical protein